jgi:site-specific DNA-methyltransferase (adenine-specific)
MQIINNDLEQNFKNELNKYYIEDCIYTLENRIPDNSIDLVLTSPPYSKMRNYNNNYCFDFERIAKLLTQKLVNGGVIVWVVGDQTIKGSEMGTSFRQALYFKDVCGLNIHDTMIFEKNTTSFPAKRKGNRYSQIFDFMFIFSKNAPKTVNLICDKKNRWAGYVNFGKNTYRDKNDKLVIKSDIKPVPEFSPRNNIWRYVTTKKYSGNDNIAYDHPAIFPEKLAEDHIITWTNEGDIIYDPFLGSGTVTKIAKKLKRYYIGSELNAEYEYIIKARLEKII